MYAIGYYSIHVLPPYDNGQSYTTAAVQYNQSSGLSWAVIAIIASAISIVVIFAIATLLIVCLVYKRRSFMRRRNQTYSVTQPTSDYTPVPPRGYQPVATDDYTTTPTVPSSDVPSEPPPEYTPSVSTDDVPMLTVQ